MKRKDLVKRLAAGHVYPDMLRKRGDTYEVKAAYFYHMNRTAEGWADKVATALGGGVSVTGRDDFRAWPKTSYLVAVVDAA